MRKNILIQLKNFRIKKKKSVKMIQKKSINNNNKIYSLFARFKEKCLRNYLKQQSKLRNIILKKLRQFLLIKYKKNYKKN